MIAFVRSLSPRRLALAALSAVTLLAPLAARAQFGDAPKPAEMMRVKAAPVKLAAGGAADAAIALTILEHWHVNANPPANETLIPTEVELTGAAGVTAAAPRYPAPRIVKLEIDPEPLLVWDGTVTATLPLRAAANATNGVRTLRGVVRFQACNDQVCLAPASVPFTIDVEVTGGAAPPADAPAGETPADSAAEAPPAAAPGAGFTTAPPANPAAATIENPLAKRIESGGLLAYLTLFLIGLALNLTPCVYPMLGVTVSIFGARRSAPPAQVIGFALLYVLGMAIMYSTLGVVAALTGGLFGSFLQSPVVLLAIGALMIALSLSMFGLYELQPPAWLLSKLGGAQGTSAIGIFLSGLVVGVFAAPCVGPPVVALLAVVGAKGDPVFGFTTFFALALGLGFPYLVLGTFSNLLQNLPRSGDWMVWVKKVFGVILVAVGLFYALLAFAPKSAGTVVPVALIAGGLYLGFLEKSAAKRRGFQWLKRAVGVAGLVGGAWIVMNSGAKSVPFAPASHEALDAALAQGKVVMVDFSADWCVPCHELENFTFTDRRVIAEAANFAAFKVDLTRYDSPEAEAWRKQYDITGVPTVVFLKNGGGEVRVARVEGFLPADDFLERMRVARSENAALGR